MDLILTKVPAQNESELQKQISTFKKYLKKSRAGHKFVVTLMYIRVTHRDLSVEW